MITLIYIKKITYIDFIKANENEPPLKTAKTVSDCEMTDCVSGSNCTWPQVR